MGANDETASCHSVEADRKEPDGTDNRPDNNADGTQEIFWTPEEEARLVRKIDGRLLPSIWLMYLLSYMDRTKSVRVSRRALRNSCMEGGNGS